MADRAPLVLSHSEKRNLPHYHIEKDPIIPLSLVSPAELQTLSQRARLELELEQVKVLLLINSGKK